MPTRKSTTLPNDVIFSGQVFPFTSSDPTVNVKFNADYWDGYHITDYLPTLTTRGYLGIGTRTPQYQLDLGGGTAADIGAGGKTKLNIAMFVGNNDGTLGLQFRNTNSGEVSDSRFSCVNDANDEYITIMTPSNGSNTTLFGLLRGTANYIFNNAISGGTPRTLVIGSYQPSDLVLGTNNVERIRITSAGNVGVGTTAPVSLFHMNGYGKFVITSGYGSYGTMQLLNPGYGESSIIFASGIDSVTGGAGGTLYSIYGDAWIWGFGSGMYGNAGDKFSIGATYPGQMMTLHSTANAIGINQPFPTARLHLGAGTATAGTAPLKFTAGVLNTEAEAGTIEYVTGVFNMQTDKLRLGTSANAQSASLEVWSSNNMMALWGDLATSTSTGKAIAIGVAGDGYGKAMFYTNGVYGLGPGGNPGSTRDTFLGRSGVATFIIAGNFALTSAGNLVMASTGQIQFNASTEYINSANAGYLDLNATTGIRLNKDTVVTGNMKATTYNVGTDAGIDATVTYVDTLLGARTLTFKKGILTAQT